MALILWKQDGAWLEINPVSLLILKSSHAFNYFSTGMAVAATKQYATRKLTSAIRSAPVLISEFYSSRIQL